MMRTPSLTTDQKKAAEAAFQKQPFNPAWSEAAREVYEGITAALLKHELARNSQEVEAGVGELAVCGGKD